MFPAHDDTLQLNGSDTVQEDHQQMRPDVRTQDAAQLQRISGAVPTDCDSIADASQQGSDSQNSVDMFATADETQDPGSHSGTEADRPALSDTEQATDAVAASDSANVPTSKLDHLQHKEQDDQ